MEITIKRFEELTPAELYEIMNGLMFSSSSKTAFTTSVTGRITKPGISWPGKAPG